MAGKKHCCDFMEEKANFECPNCKDKLKCPDKIMVYDSKKKKYGIMIPGSYSYIEINYCPWCGKKL